MSNFQAFEAAAEMLQPTYTHAALHVIAELRGTQWCNLYTSFIYGREIDLLSVPAYYEHAIYDSSVLCVRARITRLGADTLLASAQTGTAMVGNWSIVFAVEEVAAGFRPATTETNVNESSFWETSLWTREWIGTEKLFNGERLKNSNAWKVAEYLDCLLEARWLPIPLHRHPEKLGDIDEIWPSPISLESSIREDAYEFEVRSQEPSLLSRNLAITGRLLRNDLIIRAVNHVGRGPHRIDEAIDKIDLLVTVDGIPMDAHAHGFIRALTMSTTFQNNDSFTVSAYKSRPEMRFPVPQKPSAPTVIGTPRAEQVRHRAWIVGSLFRLYRQPADSERVYDPGAASGVVEQAFRDLQVFGRHETRSEVLVADPYALDERALDAIAVIVSGGGPVGTVKVLTAFNSPPEGATWFSKLRSRLRLILDTKRRARLSARQQTEAATKVAAQNIATKLNVSISFYRIESLHDRFLLVGDRLWHVGCSFNAFGQEISAVIEMRDERAKASVLDIFERTTARPPVFTVTP